MQRKTKQAFIIFVYLFFLILFLSTFYFSFFYQKPSCLDGKKNQDETGIDCGGKCSQYCLADLTSRPLVVSNVETLAYTSTSSDALGTVTNENAKAALKNAQYTFVAYDQAGTVLAEQSGKFSLLPLETRTLVALGLPSAKVNVARTELVIENEEWVAFTDFTEPPEIFVVNQQFSFLSGDASFAEVKALVQNESSYDIRSLVVVVVLRDQNNKALSVNKTTINTLQSGEERDFRLIWPQGFEGIPIQTDMEVHLDALAEDAFTKQYFPGGKFQSLFPE